jgi:hypothetical protein
VLQRLRWSFFLKVSHLKVEQLGALVTSGVLLVTIVAKTQAPTFHELSRGELLERLGRRWNRGNRSSN